MQCHEMSASPQVVVVEPLVPLEEAEVARQCLGTLKSSPSSFALASPCSLESFDYFVHLTDG